MRYRKGDNATFLWTFSFKLSNIPFLQIKYHNSYILIKYNARISVSEAKYKGRVNLFVSEHSIKFVLNDVNKDDVIYGVYYLYTYLVFGTHPVLVTDRSAELYLFGKYLSFQ